MGVQNLWDLLGPTGTRVDVHALAGKRVAVDASIWLVQFIKAMRDDRGEVMRNAHLLGFFRRIVRLLCNRIRPVFVFDGATPALKRQTTALRRRRRLQADVKLKRVAEKLLLQQLKQHALQQKAQQRGGAGAGPAALSGSAAQAEEADALLAASLAAADADEAEAAAEHEAALAAWQQEAGDAADEEDEDEDALMAFDLPELADGEELDVSALAALPTSIQMEFIARLRERQVVANRERFQAANAAAPSDFSALQMETYIKNGRVKRQLTALVREGAAGATAADDALRAQRIAGDTTQEFVFTKRFSPEGRARDGPSAWQSRSSAKMPRQAPAPQFQFGALHPVLPPPMPGTLKSVHAAPPPMASPAAAVPSPAETQLAEAEAACSTAADVEPAALEISFEVPAGVAADDDDEWEDVEAAPVAAAAAEPPACYAPAADAVRNPAAQEAAPVTAVSAATSPGGDTIALLSDSDGSPSAKGAAKQPVAAAAPLSRSQVYTRSRGFVLGRSLDEWEGSGGPAAAPALRREARVSEEERDIELAICASLTEEAPLPAAAGGVVITLLDEDEDEDVHVVADAAQAAAAKAAKGKGPAREAAARELPGSATFTGSADLAMDWQPVRDEDDAELQAALAASLAPQPKRGPASASGAAERAAAPDAAVSSELATVTVSFQARTWSMSWREFHSVCSNMCRHWPEWLPSPIDLEEQPVTVRCAGHQWLVDTPMESSLLDIADDALQAAKGKTQPAAQNRPAPRAVPPPPRAMPPPPATLGASGSGVMAHGGSSALGPEWSDKWAGVSSVWEGRGARGPADAAPGGGGSGSGGARAATAEEEAWLAAEEEEARAEADAAAAAEFSRERAVLQAEQRSAARAADTVTPEMYSEVQELLTMLGIPFIIAPTEAEAQCAWLDAEGLVDGVVTDDSDVFLFGARTVYRNIFESKKFVEVYHADTIRTKLGLDRERLAQLALLLGSDYTPGVAGVGIVNALEIVRAFPSMAALGRFKDWVNAPESDLVAAAVAHAAGGGAKRKGRGRGASLLAGAEVASPEKDAAAADEAPSPGADSPDPAAAVDAAAEEEFKQHHSGRRKSWVLADSFPAQNVVDAYLRPQVDRSRQRFEWGVPDEVMLRLFCERALGWSAHQVEPVLRDIMRQHNLHETQRTLQTFFRPQESNQPVAKVRSKRLQKAIKGLTGREDPDLALGNLSAVAPPKPKRKRKPAGKKTEQGAGGASDDDYVPDGGTAAGCAETRTVVPRRAQRVAAVPTPADGEEAIFPDETTA